MVMAHPPVSRHDSPWPYVQTFQSLELALEAAEALGPEHFVIDRHGLQIWNQERKLLRDEE